MTSNELITLEDDVKYSHKASIYLLISQSCIYNIDILSEYEQHYKDISNIFYVGKFPFTYNPKNNCLQNKCIDILYSLDDNIFYKLLFDYINKNNTSYKDYEYHYDRNLNRFITRMFWKTDTKYIKLLKIVNLDNFLEFKIDNI
jgi:hypothetical protein